MLYQTHARVSLGAIRANLRSIRQTVGGGRKILVAVKANGYGHGAVAISQAAAQAGADWLGVATVPEALELREAGIGLPILKFSPLFEEEMAAAIGAGLAACVCERENIGALEAVALELARPGPEASAAAVRRTDESARLARPFPVHLKVDTGMGRIGCTPAEAPLLAAFIERECPHLKLQGVFTHLPVSDDNAPYTTAQLERFKSVAADIEAAIGRRPELVHCSNSGAVFNHSSGWLDMVRPGIMVYGLYTGQAGVDSGLVQMPALSLHSRVSFVKPVAAGTAIGYGRSWVAPRDTFIATIPVGYADGFNRLFSNRGRVLIGGRSYPIIGRVCMDQSMVDLGPDSNVQPGAPVTLLGSDGEQEISCAEWAERLGTITYEVTCQLSPRVQRVYVE
ncbi:MAG: alanine racemase [Spirochaetes bacterium GWD1_61_31]|nr:MAG: alanine racemase [Spirochaetes bacterium GWB1_60_80]OHD37043.1 MAG: alanine racemase [Spirochaetes bacterium GWD1_61_31]HAP42761.1 alanine racemase [Spirochaetaceae bacterium]HBO40465.1 alanine racemase [Spirochaetaceae bacterium]HCQ87478.1 alanine racemase [Spirochaetaceae bacterium]